MRVLPELSLHVCLGLAAVTMQGCFDSKGPDNKESVIEMVCSDEVAKTVASIHSEAIAALSQACKKFKFEALDACMGTGATSINKEKTEAEQKLSAECKGGLENKLDKTPNLLKAAKDAMVGFFKKHKDNVKEARRKFKQGVRDATTAAQDAIGKSDSEPKAQDVPEEKFDTPGVVMPTRGMAPARGTSLGAGLTALMGVSMALGIWCARSRRTSAAWTLIDGGEPENLFSDGLD